MFFKTSAMANFVKTLRRRRMIAQSCALRVQEFSSQDTSHENSSLIFAANYTQEQQTLILQKINTSTVDELQRYSITGARLKRLTAYRDRYGSFESISDVLLLQGLDVSVLDKFCKSIVKGESQPKSKATNTKSDVVTPALSADDIAAIDTITGIRVSGSVISWAQLDTACNLLEWDCVSVEDVAMKNGLVATVEAVASVVSKVPASHAYVMESDPIVPFSRINSVAYYLHLQRQQIVSTIISLLGNREQQVGGKIESNALINNVYMMRTRVPARLFNLLVGSEMVSAKTVAEKMIYNDDDAIIQINANMAMRKSYELQDMYHREQMNWALLLTSAFLSLSILETSVLKTGGRRAHRESNNIDNCTVNKEK